MKKYCCNSFDQAVIEETIKVSDDESRRVMHASVVGRICQCHVIPEMYYCPFCGTCLVGLTPTEWVPI